jgi:MoaA/NifB/PqqE/SkfB family radical SAM enzyme
MLTAIHLLLTYACNLKCGHCFLFCGPDSPGKFTIDGMEAILDEAKRLGTIEAIYFEGGEPFLSYDLLLEGVRLARQRGFNAGIVTNGCWASGITEAKAMLKPLAELGIADLSISDDALHYSDKTEYPSKIALAAAQDMGIPIYPLRKYKPEVKQTIVDGHEKGQPEISGGIKFRGRAVENFTAGLPTKAAASLKTCPWEDLRAPKRVHIDAYGNVQVCQGISIGNCWKTPLTELIRSYDPDSHPICGPLLRGGPLQLGLEHGLDIDCEFVDECHCCFMSRLKLIEKYPDELCPRQVYGLG